MQQTIQGHFLLVLALWMLCMFPFELLFASESVSEDGGLMNGLVSYWPLDEVSGTRYDYKDINNLYDSGGVTSGEGVINSAANFVSSLNQALATSTNADIRNGEMTWSVWVMLKQDAEASKQIFVSTGDEVSGVEYSIRYDFYDGSGMVSFYRARPGNGSDQVTYLKNLGDARWHHLAVSYDGEQVSGYMDGVHIGNAQSTGDASLFYPSNLSIGARWIPWLEGGYVTGSIDEVGLWNRALTPDEVTQLYNNGKGLPYAREVEPPAPTSATTSVAFFPGIMASRLYKPRMLGVGEDQVWESLKRSDVNTLKMTVDGTSVISSIYTRDVIDYAAKVTGGWSLGGEGYAGFMSYMDQLVQDDVIHEWKALPYDWRLALEALRTQGREDSGTGNISYLSPTTTPYLYQELNRLADASPSGKVIIIAHSNGGIVAKYLLKKLEETNDPLLAKIEKLVLVGSPQLGTPKAIGELLHGTIPVVRNTVREVAENMPGAYQLIPSKQYLASSNHPLVVFEPTVVELPRYESLARKSLSTYDDLKMFFRGWNGSWDNPGENDGATPNILNDTLLTRAQGIHDLLDSWNPQDPKLQVVQIAAVGLDTPDRVNYFEYCSKSEYALPDCVPSLQHEYGMSRRGDGTVMGGSAVGNEVAASYFVEFDEYNRVNDENVAHMNMLSATPIKKLIRQELSHDAMSILPEYVTEEEHERADVVRYRFRVYSPVDIHVYNSAGNHTGVTQKVEGEMGRTYEEELPNSYYLEWGDVKYAGADGELGPVRVNLQGTGIGLFRLEVDVVRGDTVEKTLVYDKVPVTSNASGTLMLAKNGTTTLVYDLDGNKTIDARIAPSTSGGTTKVSPNLYVTTFKQVVRDSKMPAWLKLWINARLVIVEAEIKKGKKGNIIAAHAILKTVQFTLAQQTPKYITPAESKVLNELLGALIVSVKWE